MGGGGTVLLLFLNMMCKNLIFSFTLLLTVAALGQPQTRSWVESHTNTILTVDPDSSNYSDLAPIGDAIGTARIVMLGEQDHGDAPTFLAKTRLIKYLHEVKGFNVLAFESDFFGLNQGWDALDKQDVSPFLHRNIFPIWTGCNTCRPLFSQYIPATQGTSHPLQITGFDNQMILTYSTFNLIHQLDSVIRALDLPVSHDPAYSTAIIPLIDSLKFWYTATPTDKTFFDRCKEQAGIIHQQLAAKAGPDAFWTMVVQNIIAETLSFQRGDFRIARNTRDEQMALNLRWLAEHKYPGEKIIVWAANYHIAKYADHDGKKDLESMGHFFTRDSNYLRQTYVLGFNSYGGTAGRLGFPDYDIQKPRKDGFENWIPEQMAYAFTDFSKMPDKSEKFFLKGLGHMSFKTHWAQLFDGVFFIREMYPCEKK